MLLMVSSTTNILFFESETIFLNFYRDLHISTFCLNKRIPISLA